MTRGLHWLTNHWRNEGDKMVCDCPITGECGECHKPVTDHDLVADWYWCSDCIAKSLEKYPVNIVPKLNEGDSTQVLPEHDRI